CPPPARYTENRPGLSCDRATRVAYRTLETLGYTITDVVPASPERAGTIAGTRKEPDGTSKTGKVVISCDAKGAVLRPVEDSVLPDYDFSRAFGYSFKELVKRPDVEEPRAQRGLEVLVHVLTAQEGILDLGGVPATGGAVVVRVTVRNNTDRAVSLDPSTLDLVPDGGSATGPLPAADARAALAPAGAGDKVRTELLTGPRRIGPHATSGGYLVYPPGVYREARIGIEDVETGEAEGFVAPVQ
ncbi:MAG TPA: hypothetical protein VFD84_11500, partial [Candidatus Binatia bacterium]|nr:hypothetical protein [Candidatus Binatia bacterium]